MSLLDKAIDGAIGAVQDFFEDVIGFFSNIADGTAGIFKSIGVTPASSTTEVVTAVAKPAVISDQENQDVIDNVNKGDISSAADILEAGSDLTREEIVISLTTLQDTVAGTKVVNVGDKVLEDPYEVGNIGDGSSAKDYRYKEIGTVEELEAEISSIKRGLTELVVHYTESYTNANLTALEINERAIKLGAPGIPYHYIIQRNGVLQRGANVEKSTPHSRHAINTIAIAFVGGYNTATQSKDFEVNSGARGLNRVQYNTFDQFLRVFYNNYPGGQVLGHNDVDAEHFDPGFDVIEYCYSKFGRINKFENTFEQAPFTPEELNNL